MVGDEVVEKVRGLLPMLRERSPEGEELRRLPDDLVKELKDTGLVRLLQPARYGGMEAHPRTFWEAALAIAGACGSAGWVSSAEVVMKTRRSLART